LRRPALAVRLAWIVYGTAPAGGPVHIGGD
jgi:hypothetical protein